jgi:hypothetical protein
LGEGEAEKSFAVGFENSHDGFGRMVNRKTITGQQFVSSPWGERIKGEGGPN